MQTCLRRLRVVHRFMMREWDGPRHSNVTLNMLPLKNKNIKMNSFKSSENIQKKEDGPDRSVSDNQSSSVTLKELAMKARKIL